MDADAWLVGHEPRERSALEPDQIDVNIRVGQRARVVLHAGAAAEIRKRDASELGLFRQENSAGPRAHAASICAVGAQKCMQLRR